jgi:hypothetical protein
MFSTLNQSLGKPQLVTWLQLASPLVKVPLSIWFTFGGAGLPAMGAGGLRLGDRGRANWLMVVLAVWLLRTERFLPPYAHLARMESPTGAPRRFARLGVPAGLSVLVEVTSFTLMALFIARLGTRLRPAHQIAANLTAVMYMVPLSLGIATSARVSFWLGAGDPPGAARLCIRPASSWRCVARCCVGHAAGALRGSSPLYSTTPQVVAVAAGCCWPSARVPPGRCGAGAVRVRAALLPRGGGAAGGLLRAAVGRGRWAAATCWPTAASGPWPAHAVTGWPSGCERFALALLACSSAAAVAGTAAQPPRDAPAASAAGTRSRRREPAPGVLSMRSSPPWRCTTCLTIASPSPVPPVSRERLRSTR